MAFISTIFSGERFKTILYFYFVSLVRSLCNISCKFSWHSSCINRVFPSPRKCCSSKIQSFTVKNQFSGVFPLIPWNCIVNSAFFVINFPSMVWVVHVSLQLRGFHRVCISDIPWIIKPIASVQKKPLSEFCFKRLSD